MTIVTRSMSKSTKNTANKSTKFKVNIDFNEASLAWRSNKQSIGNGCFEYKTFEKPKRTRHATQRYSP